MDLIYFLLALSLLVLLHEMGHFLMALRFGIPIEEFGIGFPPRLATLFTWRGVRFTLNLIPFGGFVRPKSDPEMQEHDALRRAPWRHQFLVVAAGPLVNLLIGVVLLGLIYTTYGLPAEREIVVWYVEPNSPAMQAGMQPGDRILAVDGQPVQDVQTLHLLIRERLGRPMRVTVRRGEQTLDLQVVARKNPPPNQGPMGIRVLPYGWTPVSFVEAWTYALRTTGEYAYALASFPVQVLQARFTGAPRPEGELIGFRGMYTSLRSAFMIDRLLGHRLPAYSFSLIAMLSISFGVLNLMPIPALDGGRLVVILGEALLRRRLPVRVEYAIMFLGFVFLMFLMVVINLREWLPQ